MTIRILAALLLAALLLPTPIACDDPPPAEPEPEWITEQVSALAEIVTLDPLLHPTEGRLYLSALALGSTIDAVTVIGTGQQEVTVYVVGPPAAEVRINGVRVAAGGQITVRFPAGG